jgi:tRNA(Ile2) C34 agmatinyltransferase TiaS
MLYIGIDDTDIIDARGTGQLARVIADDLSPAFSVVGVVRHQLLFDSRIPYTAKNSSASILVDADSAQVETIFQRVKSILQAHFVEGSDPGLAVAVEVDSEIIAFGQLAKTEIIEQSTAENLAQKYSIHLVGLGGTNGGIIGALATLGLASRGDDGRYIRVGNIRDLEGLQTIEALHQAGIDSVRTIDENIITSGMVLAEQIRPSRRNHQPVLYVEKSPDGHWLPLKID